MTSLHRFAIVLTLLAATATACGIPADETPRSISDEQAPPVTEEAATPPTATQTAPATLYFSQVIDEEEGDVLVETTREVPSSGESSPTPAIVLEALLDGATEEQQEEGITTKVPANTELAGQPELTTGILTIDLNRAISGVQGERGRLPYGQLTCTATELDGVDAVLFTVEGEPVRPQTADGETSTGPLSCDDFSDLVNS